MSLPRRMTGLTYAVLLVSVMLNAFCLSFLGIRYVQNRAPICIDHRVTINGLIASLPRADQARFAAVLKEEKPQYLKQLMTIGVRRAALDQAVQSASFSPELVQQEFKSWQNAWNDFISVFGFTLIDATARISPEGRRALIQAFPNHPHCN